MVKDKLDEAAQALRQAISMASDEDTIQPAEMKRGVNGSAPMLNQLRAAQPVYSEMTADQHNSLGEANPRYSMARKSKGAAMSNGDSFTAKRTKKVR